MAKSKAARSATAPSEAAVSALVMDLRPETPITASEFLKRAFRSGAVEKVEIQRFSGGTWSWAEDVDALSPAFNPEAILTHLMEHHGRRRFRLGAVVDGSVVAHHLVNIDGWQQAEAEEAARMPKGPILSASARPVAPGATSEIVATLKERMELQNIQVALEASSAQREEKHVERDAAPVKMMGEMMAGMMAMMREAMGVMQAAKAPAPQADQFTQYLMQQVTLLNERLNAPPKERDVGTITKVIDTIDELLQKVLSTSVAELVAGKGGAEAPAESGTVTQVIRGVFEGLRPHMDDIIGLIKARSMAPSAPGARVIPFPTRAAMPVPDSTSPPTTEEAPMIPQEMRDVLDALIEAIKSKNFRVVDAMLDNPPLGATIKIDPEVPASVYVMMFKTIDPRFKDLAVEIGQYLDYLRTTEEDTP